MFYIKLQLTPHAPGKYKISQINPSKESNGKKKKIPQIKQIKAFGMLM